MTHDQVIAACERIFRRVLLAVGRGKVGPVVDSGGIQTMQVTLGPLEVRDGTPRIAEFGFTSNPPSGSDAVGLFVAGDRSNGVVVGTNHQPSRPTGLASGESMLYSQDGKQVYMTADGGIVVNAKGQNVVVNGAANVTWNCSGTFTLNGNMVLNGNLQLNGNIGQSGAEGTAGTAEFTAPITAPDIVLPNGRVNEHYHVVPAAPGNSDVMTG
jgi:phage baseplate assembly protein V